MSFWTRWQLTKFNPNHGDDGKFTEAAGGARAGQALSFDDAQDATGYRVPAPDPRDDKMAVLNSLLTKNKAALEAAEIREGQHPNHYDIEDFALADDEA